MQNPATPSQGWSASTPSRSYPQPEHPLLLGRYRVVETRGAGGFAAVHVCWDIRLQRKVAIKCMPLSTAAGASSSTLQEALDEARITSRLTHPNIVTVHDFEVTADTAYLIMEYVDGLTLAELLARVEGGMLTYDECAHLLDCLANALAYAHENGVLHLDIKPSNIFIDTSANMKLGDFGMASLASAAGWEGARGGTIGYMPPEQLQCGMVDERTDVFALAVVCYQALTGTSPFAGPDAEFSLKKIDRGARPLGKIESQLAGPVTESVARAMSPEPSRRPSTAGEFADAVLPYLGDEAAGKESVAELMAQVTGETGPDEDTWEQAAHVRAIERWPWLPQAASRGACALATGILGWKLAPIVAGATLDISAGTASLVGLIALGAISAAAPGAGGALALLLVCGAILASGVYSPAFLVAVLSGVTLGMWWTRIGSRSRASASGLLMPAAFGVPTAGSAICGATLRPAAALVTSALGVLLQVAVGLLGAAAGGEEFVRSLAGALSSPATWEMVAGAGCAAALASLIGNTRGPVARSAAQVVCAFVLVATRTALPGMENAGLWLGNSAPGVAVAVVCSVLMSIAIVTLGPAPKPREDE